MNKYAPKRKKVCVICNKIFKPNNGTQKTCGLNCRSKKNKMNRERWGRKNLYRDIQLKENWRRKNKDKVNANVRKYYKLSHVSDKCKARSQSQKLLIKLGVKKKGKCLGCKEDKILQIHHLKYTRDDFILICEKCHLKEHNKIKRK